MGRTRPPPDHVISNGLHHQTMLAHKVKLLAGSLLAGSVGYAGWTVASNEVKDCLN